MTAAETMMKAQRSAAQKARSNHEVELADLERTAREQQEEIRRLIEETQREREECAEVEKARGAELAELKADQSKQQEYKNTLDAQVQNLQSPMNYFS